MQPEEVVRQTVAAAAIGPNRASTLSASSPSPEFEAQRNAEDAAAHVAAVDAVEALYRSTRSHVAAAAEAAAAERAAQGGSVEECAAAAAQAATETGGSSREAAALAGKAVVEHGGTVEQAAKTNAENMWC